MQDHQLYIGGQWRRGGAGTAEAVSPWRGAAFASVAVGDPSEVGEAVVAASAAWHAWANASAFERADWCGRIVAGIRQHRDELARTLTLDQGKPLAAEALDEVDELAEYFLMAAEDAKRVEGALPASTSAGRRILASRLPLGRVAFVAP